MTLSGKKTDVHKQEYYYRASGIQLLRPMTFTGTIGPVLAGTGIAAGSGSVHFNMFAAFLIAALLIQAAVNMLNDYFDFRNGQDSDKWVLRTEQAAVSHGPSHHSIPYIAGGMFLISAIIGIYLAYHSSLWIIAVGISGIIFGFFYSGGSRPLCSVGLGETIGAVFLGFAATILAYIVQGHSFHFTIAAVAVPFAILISSMILTNNIRDIEKDYPFRKTLGILLGRNHAAHLLTLLLVLAYLWILLLAIFGIAPWMTMLAIFALPLAAKLHWSFRPNAKRSEEIAAMKLAAQHHWLFSLLFAIGIWIGYF